MKKETKNLRRVTHYFRRAFGTVDTYIMPSRLHVRLKLVEHSWRRAAKNVNKGVICTFHSKLDQAATDTLTVNEIRKVGQDSPQG